MSSRGTCTRARARRSGPWRSPRTGQPAMSRLSVAGRFASNRTTSMTREKPSRACPRPSRTRALLQPEDAQEGPRNGRGAPTAGTALRAARRRAAGSAPASARSRTTHRGSRGRTAAVHGSAPGAAEGVVAPDDLHRAPSPTAQLSSTRVRVWSGAAGSCTWKRHPPSMLVTLICPWCACTIPRAMASPSPVPWLAG